jgi:DNA adenine methylase
MIGPLSYVGGKRRLAPRIVSLLPGHVTYVEPFCGGAQVFFHKAPSRVEVLNDVDREIVNFLRVCQHHPDELIRILKFMAPSRTLFAQFAEQNPSGLTDVQRAARFFYLQKNAFGGQTVRQHFHYCVCKPPNFNLQRLRRVLLATAERLRLVQVECLPYQAVLQKYDRATTLFYIDPPYVGAKLYRANFSERDFAELGRRLAALKGRFLLSINDCALARALFGRFEITEVAVAYTAARNVPRVTELLVSNFALEPRP